jgi:hypothetical protein
VNLETELGECARSRLVRNSVQTKCMRKIVEERGKSNDRFYKLSSGFGYYRTLKSLNAKEVLTSITVRLFQSDILPYPRMSAMMVK